MASNRSDIEVGLDGLVFFRHKPETLATFAARITIPGVVDGLTLATPNGCHVISVDILANVGGEMVPVLQVRGEAGRLTVTNAATGAEETISF